MIILIDIKSRQITSMYALLYVYRVIISRQMSNLEEKNRSLIRQVGWTVAENGFFFSQIMIVTLMFQIRINVLQSTK
jgi:hypothetical protein